MSDDFRARVLDAMHRSLHELGVRIPALTEHPGDHCNLVAEVALDALLPVLAAGIMPHRWDHDYPDSTPSECGPVPADSFYYGVLHSALVVRRLLPPVVRDPSQTSTGVDDLPDERRVEVSAQQGTDTGGPQ